MSDSFLPDSIGSADSPFDLVELIKDTLGQSAYFGSQLSEQSDYRREAFDDLIYRSTVGNYYLKAFLRHSVENYPSTGVAYLLDDGRRIPTLREHFMEFQEINSALPIWRPDLFVNCKHHDLSDDECFQLLDHRNALMPRKAIDSGATRNPGNASDIQKDSYQLVLLNLNLGKVNRKPVIGGHVNFPSWIRNEDDRVVLPRHVFRHGAHIGSLLEAHDDHGSIRKHKELCRDNAMSGMVVHAEIPAQSIVLFFKGTHADGNFIELLSQSQYETQQKSNPKNNFWIFHGCVFRVSFGHVTSGEMVDPGTGTRTTIRSDTPSTANAIQPHHSPLASTRESSDQCLAGIQGMEAIETCDLLKPTSGSDRFDVRRLGLAECRVAVFIFLPLLGEMPIRKCARNGLNSLLAAFSNM